MAETEVACLAALPLRVLVVANRTAATPDLIAAVRRYAQQRPTTFALLIPDAPRAQHPDWTLEFALSLLDRAAGGRVTGLPSTHRDPVAAIQNALAAHPYDWIILSTPRHRTSRWLRRDLPRRLESLGVPVEVIRPERERLTDITGPPLLSGCELWLQAQSGGLGQPRRRRLDSKPRPAAGGAGRG